MIEVRTVPRNISHICRLCLSEECVTLSIFGEDDPGEQSSVPLSFRILACVSVEVSPGDGLPTLICSHCLNKINNWHDFKQMCDSAQATLKEWQSVSSQVNHDRDVPIKQEPVEVEVTEETVDITEESETLEFTVFDLKQEEVEVMDHDGECGASDGAADADDPLSLSIIETSNSNLIDRPVKTETVDSDIEFVFQLPGEGEETISIVPNIENIGSGRDGVLQLPSEIKSEPSGERPHASTSGINRRKVIRRKKLTLRKRRSIPKPITSANVSVPLRSMKPFTCSVCPKAFSYNYLLKRHMISHAKGRHVCSICMKRFSTKANLERHVRLHSGAKPYTCQGCFQDFPYESLYLSHVNGESGHACPARQVAASSSEGPEIFDCYLCKSSFPSRLKLKMHMSVHSQYKCPKCNKTFSGGISLSNHLRSHTTKGFKRHSCRLCHKSFTNIAALASHKKYHYNTKRAVSNPIPPKVVSNSMAEDDDDTSSDYTPTSAGRVSPDRALTNIGFSCKVCHKWVKNHSALNRHMTTHTKLKLYSCTICNASMGYASSVHKHMKLIHGMVVDFKTIKPQISKDPSQDASTPSLLTGSGRNNLPSPPEQSDDDENKHHITKKNFTFSKSYNCKFCHKIFPNKHMLATHLKIVHLGKKTYKCTVCNKVFAYKSFLLRHSKVHVGQILYTCCICLKSFADQKTLNNHKGVHTRFRHYTCAVCNKSFNGVKAWEQHQNMHKRGLIFSCKLCGKKFISKSELHEHKKMHIKLKIYSCAICKNSYHSSSALSKHKRKHAHNEQLREVQSGLFPTNRFMEHNNFGNVNPNFLQESRPVCNICNKTFSCVSALTKHKQLHMKKRPLHRQGDVQFSTSTAKTANDKDDIVCVLCSRQFTDYASLIRHKGWHTRRPESVTKEEPRLNPCFINLNNTKVVPNTCDICKKSFSSSTSLSKHLKLHYSDLSTEPSERKFSNFDDLDSKSKVNKQRYICSICSKQFHSKKALITHRGWHSRQSSSLKKSNFLTTADVIQMPTFNLANVKEEQRTYFCGVCSKSFTTATALGKHKHFHTRNLSNMRSKNSMPEELQIDGDSMNEDQDTIYACNICPKTFKCEDYLVVHKRIHTGERPYTCDVCPQAYHRRSNLWKHKKTHSASFKAFSCAVCHKEFTLKKQFNKHMLMHSRPQNMFPCSTCDKAFTRVEYLRQHEKSHF